MIETFTYGTFNKDAVTPSITSFCIMTLNIQSVYVTLSITDTPHNNALLRAVMLNVVFYLFFNILSLC